MVGTYAGYQGLGAVSINLGQDFSACMQQELASHKAGGAYNPARCTAMMGKSSASAASGIPTYAWIALGVALVGGAAAIYHFKH